MRHTATPALDELDHAVISEIESYRKAMREPKKWTGQLRRNLLAKAIQGSNSVEGYDINDEDAVAAVDEEEPLTADEATWAEIRGYRSAMSYVLQLADDPHFRLDQNLVRSLHYMMLAHDLSKSPGRYRLNSVFVVDEGRGEVVYESPDFRSVPALCQELVDELSEDDAAPSFVRAAMAHLNLVMIHPFRDGNGRMARCLQTLILARDSIVTPEFSSIEEFLGSNTPDYYAVLGKVGQGSWNPQNSARAWVKFTLRAHHMQAQTVVARLSEASSVWSRLDDIAAAKGVHERSVPILYDASFGFRIRRSNYVRLADVEERTATRDLQQLVDADLLVAQGERRGRTYVASDELRLVRSEARRRRPRTRDPYVDAGGLAGILHDQGVQTSLPFS